MTLAYTWRAISHIYDSILLYDEYYGRWNWHKYCHFLRSFRRNRSERWQTANYYYSNCWHTAKVESGRPPAAAAGCVNHRPPQLCTVADVKAEYRRPSRPDLGFQGPCHSALVPTLPTSCLWPPFVRSDLVTKNPGGQAPPTKQRLANANIDLRTSLIQFFKHGHLTRSKFFSKSPSIQW